MQQHKWKRIRIGSAFVNLVQREARHRHTFMAETAESSLLRAPGEVAVPVVEKLAEVIQIRSSRPTVVLDNRRLSGVLQPRSKIIEDRFGHYKDWISHIDQPPIRH
jgi:hypothetical protein